MHTMGGRSSYPPPPSVPLRGPRTAKQASKWPGRGHQKLRLQRPAPHSAARAAHTTLPAATRQGRARPTGPPPTATAKAGGSRVGSASTRSFVFIFFPPAACRRHSCLRTSKRGSKPRQVEAPHAPRSPVWKQCPHCNERTSADSLERRALAPPQRSAPHPTTSTPNPS